MKNIVKGARRPERSGMRYTSAEAGKLIKKLEDEIRRLQENEQKSATFRAASTEDPETLRPEYDFAETQAKIAALQEQLRTAKHAVNVFNTTHTLPGFDGLTIDQALVLLPQLNAQKEKLRMMAARLPKERVLGYNTGNIIDYTIANYDIAAAADAYQEVSARLSALQLALDAANTTETMDI